MSYFPFLRGKKVLLVSHELTITGAPLLLAQTGADMAASGAKVGLTSLGWTHEEFPLYQNLSLVEVDASFAFASEADVIIANTAVAKSWLRTLFGFDSSAGQKVIWWIHEIDLETYAGEMECLGQVAAAIFDSASSLRRWQRHGLLFPPSAMAIHPGVKANFLAEAIRARRKTIWSSLLSSISSDGNLSERDSIRAELGVEQRDFLLTLVGQYGPLKGQDLLIKTVGQILEESPELPLKLLLVGFANNIQKQSFVDGLTASELATVGDNRVITRVTDPSRYYLASDAFVMNTQSPGETFGLVSIEAMAFGLPVLGTDAGGTREIVVDGVTGLLHPTGEDGQAELNANIRLLVNNRRKARKLGEAGRKRVLTYFNADRFYQEFSEVVAKVIAGRAAWP